MSNSKKYKLIKEYPGSPKLGTIVELDTILNGKIIDGRWCYDINNSPEFWEEVIERNYEILSFRGKIAGKIYYLEGNEYKCSKGYGGTLEEMLDPNKTNEIYSVKRLSDGEVFTVGDAVQYQLTTGWSKDSTSVITRFEPNGNYLDIYTTLSVSRPWATLSNSIKRIKQPLFTTEDGVDIFDNNTEVYLTDIWIYPIPYKVKYGNRFKHPMYKYFSTKEAAEEYVLMNKPCLSINDIKFLDPDKYKFERLKELVKSK